MGFADAIAKFSNKAVNSADQVVQQVATEIGGRLVKRTPVEEGEARGGWNASINGYSAAGTGRLDPGGGATMEQIAAVAATAKVGDTIFITNSVPHIIPLEHGWSDRAPNGMVSVTAREAPRIVANIAGRIRQGGVR
ncbi:hypothetical protein J2848_000353 [Azospirillum lipoferum]|uniref:hypothetical protein n=1 Tax=Azospirillum TaxID=191 RepID=UPI001478FDDF|nr:MULTISPECIES: hypothetical protein [Azospirillum]MCP1608717.1 hypothetical protein [Azospirillum lipoferum]MDW5535965.1 hypothetical protein [Azospirillum sp. NL1]